MSIYTFPIRNSSDNTINALLGETKWWSVNQTVSLTYSLISTQNSYYSLDYYGHYSSSDEYTNGFTFTAAEELNIQSAVNTWARYAKLSFTQVTDSYSVQGDLRFGGYLDMQNAYAWAYMPSDYASGGDIWFSPDWELGTWGIESGHTQGEYTNAAPGSYEYLTVLHEIGHALGLKHTFDTDGSGVTMPSNLDSTRYTIMSYNHNFTYAPTTPMLYDIQAIQYLYGTNTSYNAGNTVYQWAPTAQIFETVWDGGGIDTISAANQQSGVTINLNAGCNSEIGQDIGCDTDGDNYSDTEVNDLLYIAFNTIIENATGSTYDDALIGNAAANVLDGLAGNDTMNGGDGSDVYHVRDTLDQVIESNANTTTGGSDIVYSYLDNYTLGDNIENGRILTTNAASMTGNMLDNIIYAGIGNNALDGSSGCDTVSYLCGISGTTGVTANLALTTAQATGASGSDTLIGFENLTGTNYADRLYGNATANVLNGASGNDALAGNAGNDTLYGSAGNDTLYGGTGSDRFVFDSKSGYDALRDFVSKTDKMVFDNSSLGGIGDKDATMEGSIIRSTSGGFSKAAELVVFSSNISGAITTTNAAVKIGSATSNYALNDQRIFVVDNGTQSNLYLFKSLDTDARVESNELTLLATVNTSTTVLADYLFQA
ncbi:M10 family metallopeptidase C-terminal domain-containing protein [Chitinibacter sp. S2-10]|uniref:M10 family metallopeptidase C-terminal domain-containing protein n=1 Tax=Chitinibacter sp. S2-10 TaxID=3373597 RepID=UPI003977E3A0